MNKLKYCLWMILATVLLLPMTAYAAGSITVSKSSIAITKGKTATFVVKANNATGRIDIASSNPAVATVNVSSKWLDKDSVTVTVTGKAAGTATINVTLSDCATYDGEELQGVRKVNITVKNPASNSNSNSNKPSNSNSNSNKPSNSNSNSNKTSNSNVPVKSNNNALKELVVDGQTVTKVDDHNYVVTVEHEVDKVNINATAEDLKAVVTGNGEKEIREGDNNFQIVITSESGLKNTINVKITKKEKDCSKECHCEEVKPVVEKTDKLNIWKIIAIVECPIILLLLLVTLLKGNKKQPEITPTQELDNYDE